LQVEEYSLDSIVREAVKRNSSFFISKGINLTLDVLQYNVMTDKKWLSYILDQLLNNACKYVEAGDSIRLYAREDERAVTLFVYDSGTGIAPKDINRIFDRGFTGDNGRKVIKSTGMGLYFSKKIADMLGHTLGVKSEAGAYTEFSVVFHKLSDYFNVTKM
jgi:signal transduction histidine kinase